MGRQIKFRGKRKNTGEWLYGSLVFDCDKKPMIFVSGYSHTGLGFSGASYVDPDTIGQFTGLIDANGMSIYEGDIIRLGPDSIAIVLWNEEHGAFCIRLKQSSKVGSRPLGNWINHLGRKIEVIGSIYDNLELLK